MVTRMELGVCVYATHCTYCDNVVCRAVHATVDIPTDENVFRVNSDGLARIPVALVPFFFFFFSCSKSVCGGSQLLHRYYLRAIVRITPHACSSNRVHSILFETMFSYQQKKFKAVRVLHIKKTQFAGIPSLPCPIFHRQGF